MDSQESEILKDLILTPNLTLKQRVQFLSNAYNVSSEEAGQRIEDYYRQLFNRPGVKITQYIDPKTLQDVVFQYFNDWKVRVCNLTSKYRDMSYNDIEALMIPYTVYQIPGTEEYKILERIVLSNLNDKEKEKRVMKELNISQIVAPTLLNSYEGNKKIAKIFADIVYSSEKVAWIDRVFKLADYMRFTPYTSYLMLKPYYTGSSEQGDLYPEENVKFMEQMALFVKNGKIDKEAANKHIALQLKLPVSDTISILDQYLLRV